MPSEKSSDHELPRARRFGVELPVRCRAFGETAWREGRTENISHTGMLFRTHELLDVHTPIEITFAMPPAIGGEAGAQIMCRGEIVRTTLAASTDAHPLLAARILEYRFVRGRVKSEA
jgi:hypothetical protein